MIDFATPVRPLGVEVLRVSIRGCKKAVGCRRIKAGRAGFFGRPGRDAFFRARGRFFEKRNA